MVHPKMSHGIFEPRSLASIEGRELVPGVPRDYVKPVKIQKNHTAPPETYNNSKTTNVYVICRYRCVCMCVCWIYIYIHIYIYILIYSNVLSVYTLFAAPAVRFQRRPRHRSDPFGARHTILGIDSALGHLGDLAVPMGFVQESPMIFMGKSMASGFDFPLNALRVGGWGWGDGGGKAGKGMNDGNDPIHIIP